jgi:protein-S-isoprenylcysteine O-methyltransferase Ste14
VTELDLHTRLVLAMFGLAVLTIAVLLVLPAPYGRHRRGGWGPTIPARVGWFVMELPAVALFALIYFAGRYRFELPALFLLGLWQLHYVHRVFVFPFRMRSKGKSMPLVVVLAALAFNVLNAWINARWISHLAGYSDDWLSDPRLSAGAALFLAGFVINVRADSKLFRLRAPGESGYKIPRGGLYEFVCCPNYLGEILEWFGWALASWSLAGLAFAVYTVANLLPRALAHRRWYRKTFPDYPANRRALIPFLI